MSKRLPWLIAAACMLGMMILGRTVPAAEPADKDKAAIGEYRTLHSDILNEDRTVTVRFPTDYEDSDERYPVLYVLGGLSDARLMWAASAMEDLDQRGKAPMMLIVVVDFVSGARDSRPIPIADRPNTGKADDFLRFLTEELRPFIDANYRTAGYNVLAGFSNTGLFSSYVCLRHTDAFDTYIAASPMISSCADYMTQLMHDVFASGRTLDTRLYMNYGSNDYNEIIEMMPQVVTLFEKDAPSDLKWTMELIEDGGHVPYMTMYNGLGFLFFDWFYPKDQLQAGGLPALRTFYSDLSARYGFTVKVPNGHLDDLGFAYMQAGEHEKAIEVFTYFIEQYPKSAMAQFLLGETHRRKGDTELARACFEKALEINPTLDAARRRLQMLDEEG
ncbi:MAG TPA: alpha/beta hydrolase-fold protein [Acidobacteriota bacterium]|nr:alpha/beta hydrolase-fold protein [Acidobacteriota bacterium]